ncbi:LysE family translocator [Testudinibacter sp. P27/CKL/0425]
MMNELLAVMTITILAVISPGGDFAMTTRNSYLYGKRAVLSDQQAFKQGFITNALNPKTTLFVLSTFTQIVNPDTPLWLQIGYSAFMSLAHLIWFGLVAIMLSTPRIRNHLLSKQVYVNRIIGVILSVLGAMLLFSSATT